MAKFIAFTSIRGPIPSDFAKQVHNPVDFGLPTDDDGSRDHPLLGPHMIWATRYVPDFEGPARGRDENRSSGWCRIRGYVPPTRRSGSRGAPGDRAGHVPESPWRLRSGGRSPGVRGRPLPGPFGHLARGRLAAPKRLTTRPVGSYQITVAGGAEPGFSGTWVTTTLWCTRRVTFVVVVGPCRWNLGMSNVTLATPSGTTRMNWLELVPASPFRPISPACVIDRGVGQGA